ncbi:hypothetical protein ACET3X_007977 [Alternaria dauci]|uniref:Cytochrome P450 monooxygenase n=1 Tax=Alternaria dauci TaxID=48095 RepID=A0ABR3UAJ5_9PLEO
MAINTSYFGLWLYASTLAGSAYIIVITVYRIWFHPLSRFPGPKHMAISDLFSQWHAFVSMDMATYTPMLHRTYGNIVRIGPNRLAIEGSICWPEVYGARSTSDEDEFSKIKGFTFANDHLALIGANREDHRRQRRQMAPAFSATALQEQSGTIMHYIDKLISQLTASAKQGQSVDIVSLMNRTTFDIIGDLTFAESFHGLEGNTTFIDNIYSGLLGAAYRRFLLQFPVLKPILALYVGLEDLHKASVARKENFLLGSLKGQARMAMGAERKDGRRDFATYMLRKVESEDAALSDKEVQALSSVLVIAGSDTIATALSGFHFLIGMYAKKQKILVDEIRLAFTDESEITVASTAKLTYLRAVIEETLRLYSPVPTLPPRVSPGAQVGGQWIPRGTIIQTWQTATNRNPDSFVDPDSFEPERWLSSEHSLSNARFLKDKKNVVKSFSNGSRDCIGKNLAYAEMRTIICRILFRFDIELLSGQEKWLDQRAAIAWLKGPLMVRYKPRPTLEEA